jgi:carbon-monoxide dehydrogenase large subunit
VTEAAGAARFIGKPVPRREDRRMLTGHGRYVADVALPGMLHAAFVRSEVARGRVVHLDVEAARNHPGVHAVYTAADLNAATGPMWATMYEGAPGPPLRPLAGEDVRFVGDALAIVVADDRYVAEDAAALVELDIDPLDAVIDVEAALTGNELVHPELGTNLAAEVDTLDEGAWQAICDGAAHVVTRTFHQGRATNVPMEPRGLVVDWDPWVPELRVWSSTQNTHEVRAAAARVLGVPEHQVRAMSGDVGGGFGMKIFLTPDEVCVVLAAHRLQQPVQWIEDRRENLLAAGHARDDRATISLALDADGHLLGVRVEHLEDVGAFPVGGTGSSIGTINRLLPGPYRIPRFFYSGRAVYTSTCGRTAYRGPWVMETVIREQALDHAARELGIDPLELRRRNVLQPDELPHTAASGAVLDGITPAECLELVASLIGYDEFRREQASARGGGRFVGVGLSMFVEPTGMGAGLLGTDGAVLRITPTGVVNVHLGTGSTGNSLETTIPQIVAEHLGCALDDVVFHQGDTASSPWGHGSGGSRAAVVSGGAARSAALELHDRVVRIAADLLEAAPEDLEVAEGVVAVRGTPTRTVRLADVANHVHRRPEQIAEERLRSLEVAVRFRPPKPYTWSNAAHACTCEVDVETGEIRLVRYAVAEDCGTIINPMVVDGQIAGGVVQGIGGALLERFAYDEIGNPLTTTFLDYLLPTAADVPPIECGHIETPSEAPGGFKGMGEGGAIGAPAAVANAVADALAPFGARLTSIPVGPSDVLDLISAGPADRGGAA